MAEGRVTHGIAEGVDVEGLPVEVGLQLGLCHRRAQLAVMEGI